MMIYDDNIWWYMMIIYDDNIWWYYMMIIYDDYKWWSDMMIIYDDHIWWSSGSHLGAIWEPSGGHLGDIWESFGSHLGAIWETPGRTEAEEASGGQISYYVPHSRTECKFYIKMLILHCVFEGTIHFGRIFTNRSVPGSRGRSRLHIKAPLPRP